jgi:hypothetical protein
MRGKKSMSQIAVLIIRKHEVPCRAYNYTTGRARQGAAVCRRDVNGLAPLTS